MSPPATLAALREALARGAAAEAWRVGNALVAASPDDADAHAFGALAAAGVDELDVARGWLRRAVTLAPAHAFAWRNLAAIEEARGDHGASATALVEALALIRTSTAADWLDAARRARNAGRLGLARRALDEALARAPAALDARIEALVLARIETRQHDAERLADALLDDAPDHAQVRYAAAAVYSASADATRLQRGRAMAHVMVGARPTDAGAWDTLAWCEHKLGNQTGAIAAATRALALERDRAERRVTLARIHDRAGDAGAAYEVLASVARDTAPPDALTLRAGLALKLGDPVAALADVDAALARAADDQDAIAIRSLALALTQGAAAAADWLGVPEVISAHDLRVPDGYPDRAAFHAALADEIRAHSRLRFEPVGLAARGGYLTGALFVDRGPALVAFERLLEATVADFIARQTPRPGHPFYAAIPTRYRINAWATRVAEGGEISSHLHVDSWLSGAYYVALPPALGHGGDAGWIEFGRPPPGFPEAPAALVTSREPRLGRLYLFPSYLWHRTLPFSGDGERISISFDLAPAFD